MTVVSEPKTLPAGVSAKASGPRASDRNDKSYRQLFENSPVAGLLVNREGLIVEFNRRAADLLLIDPELRSCPDLDRKSVV